MELERCNFAWQVLGDRISPVLLKGKSEGGKQAIGWRLLPNPTSQFLLKGNFERSKKSVALDIP
jgi:hypothetical protein